MTNPHIRYANNASQLTASANLDDGASENASKDEDDDAADKNSAINPLLHDFTF